jgi:hypothetical protein
MAGYAIYSLDWGKFQNFVNHPTDQQLLAFSKFLSDGLDQIGDEWPSDPEKLRAKVKERLARPDWYGDLSAPAQEAWSNAVCRFCSDTRELGFRVDHDGVYWDVIELACKHLSASPNQASSSAMLSSFGKRPYRYHSPAKKDDDDDDSWDMNWYDYHSMHTPDEVRQIVKEFEMAAQMIEKSRNKQAINDYDSLVPAMEQLAEEGRMLFVQTDT